MPTFTESLQKMQRFARFLRLFDGKPDALPPVKPIFQFDGSSNLSFSASVHTDREWGGRSRATFRVGNAGASGSGVCGVFEGFIDKTPSLVPNEEGVTGRHGFAMLQLRTHEDEVGCEEYDALALRASGDGRLYSVSLRNAVPLAPNIAYQGFLARERRGWRTYELPFTSFAATRGGRLLGQPRVLDVARFSSLSIAVADDVEGPFRLEIRSVEALREDDGLG